MIVSTLIVVTVLGGFNLSQGEAPGETEIWNSPFENEEDRVYDNSVNDVWPAGDTALSVAEDIAERCNLTPIEFVNETTSENDTQARQFYKVLKMKSVGVSTNSSEWMGMLIDENDHVMEIVFSRWCENRAAWQEFDINYAEEKGMEFQVEFLEKLGFHVEKLGDMNYTHYIESRVDNSEYEGFHDFETAFAASLTQVYDGRKIENSGIYTTFIDSRINTIRIYPWYNITVEPYLTEYGAKHFALESWGPSYTNISVSGFAVVENKLMYHVLVTNRERVIVNETTGAYFNSIETQHYFVDVQSGQVTVGKFSATDGGTITPGEDNSSLLPVAMVPQLLMVMVLVAALSRFWRKT